MTGPNGSLVGHGWLAFLLLARGHSSLPALIARRRASHTNCIWPVSFAGLAASPRV